MADGIQDVGTRLVALGVNEYVASNEQAAKSVQQLEVWIQQAVDVINKFGEVIVNHAALNELLVRAYAGDAAALKELQDEYKKLFALSQELLDARDQENRAALEHAQIAQAEAAAAQKAAAAEKEQGEAMLTDAEAGKIMVSTLQRVSQQYADADKQVRLLEQGLRQSTSSSTNFFGEARAGRIAVAALNVELALMTVAAGETLPQGVREGARALQVITDTTTAFAFAGSSIPGLTTAAGAAIGLLVGGISALLTVLFAADPALDAVNKRLDELAKKDDVIESIAKITSSSREEAQALLDIAQKSPAAAKGLQQLVENEEPANGLQRALAGVADQMERIQKANSGAGGNALQEGLLHAFQIAFPTIALTTDLLVKYGDAARKSNADAAQGALDAAIAEEKQKEAVDALNKEFDSFIGKITSQKDLLVTLTGVTEDQSQVVTAYAQKHSEAGAQIAVVVEQLKQLKDQQIQDTEHFSKYEDAIGATTNKLKDLAAADLAAAEAEKELADFLKRLDSAEQSYNQTLAQTSHQLDQLIVKTQQQRDAAQQQFTDASADATRTRNEADANAEEQYTDRVSDIYVQRADKLADIETQFNERIAQIDQQRVDREYDIETELSNRLSDISTQLADRIFQIQQGLANKLQDLRHQYEQQQEQDHNKAITDAEALADKLLDIERTRIEATEALAFNTHEQLSQAATEHDRDRILRQAQFQQGQIDQRANDQRQDAQDQFQRQIEELERAKKLEQENYDYAVAQAHKLADQQIAEARRSAEEQMAQARRNADQQIAIAERTAREQYALAQQQQQDAIALAQRQYAEQQAIADRTRSEQLAKDHQAELDKLADAQRALTERNKAIDLSYANEVAQINYVRAQALIAYNEIAQEFANLFQLSLGFAKQLLQLAALQSQIAGYTGGGNPIGEGNLPGFGAPSIPTVPAPALPAGGSSPVITPAQTNNYGGSRNLTFNVYDATDPVKVANTVKQTLDNWAWGQG